MLAAIVKNFIFFDFIYYIPNRMFRVIKEFYVYKCSSILKKYFYLKFGNFLTFLYDITNNFERLLFFHSVLLKRVLWLCDGKVCFVIFKFVIICYK